ncbi:MAG: hypothetical protein A3A33_02600 [Candidatus Yanofskybacteria bacterium RIFCSPLOWO2_01_FULL_49_25]|uniref:Uncharacterized protein n=1 Tax=Candidatus Yanofskybacteria bacterium RIFCSPLOWO2_01_FULL_49_25 TaxID=1802701 RepID=A0A1F8GXF8_9BACT|nr:MAG: hypothetical protein A3A33_02600 [Candidatus Yanofskybacteria bacterium RIFCSPLOWO2_01_FULL_49_25]
MISFFMFERVKGIGFDSRLAVARLGLATASRFRILAEHRSGVRFPTQAKSFACFTKNIKNNIR